MAVAAGNSASVDPFDIYAAYSRILQNNEVDRAPVAVPCYLIIPADINASSSDPGSNGASRTL